MTLEKNLVDSKLPKGNLGDFVEGMFEIASASLSCNPNPKITPSYSYMHEQGKECGDYAIIAGTTMIVGMIILKNHF